MAVCFKETRFAEPQQSMSAPQTITTSAFEACARSVVKQVLDNAVAVLEFGSPCAQEESGSKGSPRTQEMGAQRAELSGSHTEALIDGPPATENAQKADESEGSELGDETEEIDEDVGLSGIHGTQMGLQDFKSFLQGTPGKNLFHLWMDIERLQSHQNKSSKNRYILYRIKQECSQLATLKTYKMPSIMSGTKTHHLFICCSTPQFEICKNGL